MTALGYVIPQAVDFLGVTSEFRHEMRKLFQKPDDVEYRYMVTVESV